MRINVEASDSYPLSRLLLSTLLVIHPSTPYNSLTETERYQLMQYAAAGVPAKMKQRQNSHCGFMVLSVTTNIVKKRQIATEYFICFTSMIK